MSSMKSLSQLPQSGLNMFKTSGLSSMINRFSQMSKKNMFFLVIGILLLLLISYYIYNFFSSSKAGFQANRENVTKDKNSNKTAELMLFSVDWCPHCKTAKPEWENLKTEYEGKQINGYTLIFTDHNCTSETPEVEVLMNKYKIEGYPTIKLIKDNQVIEYDAKPTKTTMETFLNTVL